MKPALIIGSGPSVDRIDPSWLSSYATFGCNSIFKKFQEWNYEVDNVVITDSNRLLEIGKAYAEYKGKLFIGDQRYIVPPYRYYKKILGRDFVPLKQLVKKSMPENFITRRISFPKYFATTVFDKLSASFDYEKVGINFGRSVSCSAVQIAVAQGYREIFMVGIDAQYPTPKAYFGSMIETIKHVNNQFIQNPRLMMEPFFVMIQIQMEQVGAKLYDCSEGALRFVNKCTMETLKQQGIK